MSPNYYYYYYYYHLRTPYTLLLTPYTLLLTPYSLLLTTGYATLTTHNSQLTAHSSQLTAQHTSTYRLPTADDAPSVRPQVSAPYDVTLVTGAMLQDVMTSGAVQDRALRDRIHRLHR